MDNERYIKLSRIANYRPNSKSYILTLVSVIFELVYTVMILDVIDTNKKVFAVVMVNIVLLFGLFYLAVKEKNYDAKAGYIALLVAAYMVVRSFTIVPFYLMPVSRNIQIITMNIVAAILIAISSVMEINIAKRREKYRADKEIVDASSKV